MSPVRNARYLFTAIPEDYPEEGKHMKYDDSQVIDTDNEPLNGGILVKTLALSLDPYLRSRMRDEKIESYVPAFPLGGPFNSHGVGLVVRSEHSDIKVGEHVTSAGFPHQEYFVAKDVSAFQKISSNAAVSWTLYLGVLGMPGQTAYMSWKEYSHAQKGQTLFVSTAAGAVGSLIVQLAKRDGMKVIASSGSDEKVKFARDCGADVSFNYKTQSTEEILQAYGPVDVYLYDNVGGETLDLALKYAAKQARFIVCGMISDYNTARKTYAFQNMFEIVAKEISINGFLFARLASKYSSQFYGEMPKLVQDGNIKFQEDRSYGLDKVGEAFLEVQTGKNTGKKVVVVAEQ